MHDLVGVADRPASPGHRTPVDRPTSVDAPPAAAGDPGSSVDAADRPTGGGGVPPARLREGIRLAGVALRYPGGSRPVVTGLDLHLPAGATVAIVGENGAGKTTLVKLLCGLLSPTSGRILVDGVALGELPGRAGASGSPPASRTSSASSCRPGTPSASATCPASTTTRRYGRRWAGPTRRT